MFNTFGVSVVLSKMSCGITRITWRRYTDRNLIYEQTFTEFSKKKTESYQKSSPTNHSQPQSNNDNQPPKLSQFPIHSHTCPLLLLRFLRKHFKIPNKFLCFIHYAHLSFFFRNVHMEVANKIMSQLPTSPSSTFNVSFFLNLKRNHIMAILLFAYDENTFRFLLLLDGRYRSWKNGLSFICLHTRKYLYTSKKILCIEKQVLRNWSVQKVKKRKKVQ